MRKRLSPTVVAALAWAALSFGAPAAEAGVAQTFYIPLPEDQVFAALSSIFPDADACGAPSFEDVLDPVISYVSIAPIAGGTVIVYDHWEDGYETDPANPVQASTAVWGDGDPSTGIPPGFAEDLIGVGDVVVLHNRVSIGTRQAVRDFDGGDKIAASVPVAVTRAAWASGTLTRLAGAVEVHDTREWGRVYRAPVGQNVGGTMMFQYSALLVMASKNGTRVEVDADADGIAETSVTLDEGQSHHVAGGVRVGATVTASEPVQADLITGEVCSVYQSRWFALVPQSQWSSSYFTPVSTPVADQTTVFVFNPGPDPLPVVCETLGGRVAEEVAAGAAKAFPLPDASGAHLFSEDGRPFFAVGTVDTGGSEHEWGFALIPETLLTPQALVGWGAGRDPLSGVKPAENASPVWVTAVLPDGAAGPASVCVDFDGDNRGPSVDPQGFHYDTVLPLDELERRRVYDPDGDQTGMILYVCDDSGASLAVAWGQDPTRASPGSPGIDLGTTVPPLPSMTAYKDVALAADADGDGLAGAGDTLRYVITVRNISRLPVAGLLVIDQLPEHTSYVPGSTLLDVGSGPAPLPDGGVTLFPLDESGGELGTLAAGGVFTVSFLVTVNDPLPEGVTAVLNRAVVRSATEEVEVEAPMPVVARVLHPALAIEKTAQVVVGSAGTGTIGYWKNHPEAWPVAEITIGAHLYSQAEAVALLQTPGRGDKTYDMFRQLVAARLNVLSGTASQCVDAVLAGADAWMEAHEPGSGVGSGSPAWGASGAPLHETLDDYNNGRLCAPHRDDAAGAAGLTTVTFTFTVTNTGDADLSNVAVEDLAMPVCNRFIGPLAVGAQAIRTCSAGAVAGDFTNAARATGSAAGGAGVEAWDDVFVDVPDDDPAGGALEPEGARPAGFWKGHPERWPVLHLTVGGRDYKRDGARRLMNGCAAGDMTCSLYAQLAAVRLNLLQGLDSACVGQAVTAADSWLAAHPPRSRVRAGSAAWRRGGGRLTALLQRYNRGLLCAPAPPTP